MSNDMEYGDFIVDSSNQKHIDNLKQLQEKSLRLAEYQTPESRKEMSILKSEFGIECLKIRRKRSLLRLTFSQNKKDENLVEIKHHMELRGDNKVK